MALYPQDQLSEIIRGWIYDTMAEQEREEFEREYNQYLDETDPGFDEESYLKHMSSDAAFAKMIEDPDFI